MGPFTSSFPGVCALRLVSQFPKFRYGKCSHRYSRWLRVPAFAAVVCFPVRRQNLVMKDVEDASLGLSYFFIRVSVPSYVVMWSPVFPSMSNDLLFTVFYFLNLVIVDFISRSCYWLSRVSPFRVGLLRLCPVDTFTVDVWVFGLVPLVRVGVFVSHGHWVCVCIVGITALVLCDFS